MSPPRALLAHPRTAFNDHVILYLVQSIKNKQTFVNIINFRTCLDLNLKTVLQILCQDRFRHRFSLHNRKEV